MKKHLMTTRFNDQTYTENISFIKKHVKLGCVYCSPERVSKKISQEAVMFVLEMNNDINKIMGIGMVKNRAVCGKYMVYGNMNYNRFAYVGKYKIRRDEMDEYEEKVMKALDILCFKGKRHSKRGQGLRMFPMEILNACKNVVDLLEFITNMFKKRHIHSSTSTS